MRDNGIWIAIAIAVVTAGCASGGAADARRGAARLAVGACVTVPGGTGRVVAVGSHGYRVARDAAPAARPVYVTSAAAKPSACAGNPVTLPPGLPAPDILTVPK